MSDMRAVFPIDRDALQDEVFAYLAEMGVDEWDLVQPIRRMIQNAPTLDYAPVRRGRPGIALVEHHVSDDPVYCEHSHPDDGFMEYSLCAYMKHRDRHGKKGKIDRGLPRCTLFNEWLVKDGYKHVRCDACKAACGARMKEDGKNENA